MSRNLAELKSLCVQYGLTVKQSGNREAKSDYEQALRNHIWAKTSPGQEMPEQIEPMLARNSKDLDPSEVDVMFRDNNCWVAQEKINGCRCLLKVRNPQAGRINHMTSRRISDETYRLHEVHDQLPHYRDMYLGDEWENTVVDGEILSAVGVVDTGSVITRDILQATAATLNCAPEKSIEIQSRHGKMVLLAFDLIRFKGKDVSKFPYCNPANLSDPKTRYGLLMQVVARVTEVIGDLPTEYTEGELNKKADVPVIQDPQLVAKSETLADLF